VLLGKGCLAWSCVDRFDDVLPVHRQHRVLIRTGPVQIRHLLLHLVASGSCPSGGVAGPDRGRTGGLADTVTPATGSEPGPNARRFSNWESIYNELKSGMLRVVHRRSFVLTSWVECCETSRAQYLEDSMHYRLQTNSKHLMCVANRLHETLADQLTCVFDR
jgi:hypothetical protein